MGLSRIQYTGRGSPVVACPEDGQLYENIDRARVFSFIFHPATCGLKGYDSGGGLSRYNLVLSPTAVTPQQPWVPCRPSMASQSPSPLPPEEKAAKEEIKEKKHSVRPAPGPTTPPSPRPPPTPARTPFPPPHYLQPTPERPGACHPREHPAACVWGGRPPPSCCLSGLAFPRAKRWPARPARSGGRDSSRTWL